MERILRCFPALLRDRLLRCTQDGAPITEVRLRAGALSCLTVYGADGIRHRPLTDVTLDTDALRGILTALCGGSVHTYDEGLGQGYFTPMELPGVRIGAGGRLIAQGGGYRLQILRTLCIRLPVQAEPGTDVQRRIRGLLFDGVSDMPLEMHTNGKTDTGVRSTLFYAPPGVGKTTVLRCALRALTDIGVTRSPLSAAVVDTGGELWSPSLCGCCADVLSGYPRGMGISLATRAFAPQVILCDEIGTDAEAEEILCTQAGGVPLIATAHADTLSSLLHRPCFEALYRHCVFSQYIRLYRVGEHVSFVREEVT